MRTDAIRDGRIVLLEPNINRVTQRFGLPAVANYPPLAQVRLAGQLEDDGVQLVDLRVPGEQQRFLREIEADPPALVGISLTFTSNGDEVIETARAIRQAAPDTRIVLGGSGASEDPGSFYDSDLDWICHRNGDASLAAVVKSLRRHGRFEDEPPGFYHRSEGRWVCGDDIPAPAMAELKPYAWNLLPHHYWKRYFQGYRPTGMGQMSEGCPFDCNFCSVWKVHARQVSVASLSTIQHDLLSLPDFVTAFFFADDIWMQASETQLQSLHDRLLSWMVSDYLKTRPNLWLTAETRTDLFVRQEARFRAWAREGALRRILFGVEAVTDTQLDQFSKRVTVDINSTAIRRAAECGIFVTAQFVIPCDADRAYFDEMVKFLDAHREWIDVSNFTIATPLPGTELYDDGVSAHPELADRRVVTHPAFSLFTALSPMRLAPAEFYEQVARVYRAANQFTFDWSLLENIATAALRTPWMLLPIFRMPWRLRHLTRGSMFLKTHREVQGDRLLNDLLAPIPSTQSSLG